jgi:hypothetical protein
VKNCFLKAGWIRKKSVYIPGDDRYEALILKVVKKKLNVRQIRRRIWRK